MLRHHRVYGGTHPPDSEGLATNEPLRNLLGSPCTVLRFRPEHGCMTPHDPIQRAQTLHNPLRRRLFAILAVPVLASSLTMQPASAQDISGVDDYRSLDGSGNNIAEPTLGQAGVIYPRITDANYADGVGELVDGPDPRYLSNRIFNDLNQNIFSENGVTHWAFVWGQFLDHTFGLREAGDEDASIPFDPEDPVEAFTNDLGAIAVTRSAVADGTGVDSPREQVNSVSSYIDAWAVYGGSEARLDWLRDGLLDGDPTNNAATLVDADGYLPTAEDRPDGAAPEMDLVGRLAADPTSAVVAGDVRANENLGLTAVHTLFLREHNRIVDALPDDLDKETKFQIARRVVSALQQYITYTEFLPAMGIDLPAYAGYDATIDPSITNEFATVGYRAHSQIHGEFEAEIPLAQLGADTIADLEAQGVEVAVTGDVAEIAIPLNAAFGNPGLLPEIGLGNMLVGLASEAAYANDEQIDNQLRSVLFQIPDPRAENPLECLDGTDIASCFTAVSDLGAIDVLRAYDHGMPSYNDLRSAYGLEPAESFTDITGEETEEFPGDVDADNPIDDPDILDFVLLLDGDGNELEAGTDAADGETVTAVRRTTTAARLKAVFGAVDAVDAFTGMVSEPHVAGTEFGELQLAMWTTQFEALRDGDRFFYANDPVLEEIADVHGVDFRRTLAEVIVDNTEMTDADLASNVFLQAQGDRPAPTEPVDDNEQRTDRPRRDGDDDDRHPPGRSGRGRR